MFFHVSSDSGNFWNSRKIEMVLLEKSIAKWSREFLKFRSSELSISHTVCSKCVTLLTSCLILSSFEISHWELRALDAISSSVCIFERFRKHLQVRPVLNGSHVTTEKDRYCKFLSLSLSLTVELSSLSVWRYILFSFNYTVRLIIVTRLIIFLRKYFTSLGIWCR